MMQGVGKIDVLVVGAGLAGLAAAYRIRKAGYSVAIADPSIFAVGGPGGLVERFGTKLSLPPAGMGLAPMVGGSVALVELVRQILTEFELASHLPHDWPDAFDLRDKPLGTHSQLYLRRYHSILLATEQVQDLVSRLLDMSEAFLLPFACNRVSNRNRFQLVVNLTGSPTEILCRAVVIAAGRSMSKLTIPITPRNDREDKIDLGIRLEFEDFKAFEGMLAYGPDAKILANKTRTFCLNAPGRIVYYQAAGIEIPGGAASDHGRKGNFGMLARRKDRQARLIRLQKVFQTNHTALRDGISDLCSARNFAQDLLTKDVADELFSFLDLLEEAALVNLGAVSRYHFPLVDWFWPTFCAPDKLATSHPRVWVAGDLAGHARGLLQALVSGWWVGDEVNAQLGQD